ncbi:MAG: Fe-S cluster assembly iron-binding protein IscA [Myxococcota bacterium]|jgi:Fe-S cluster assembly iron-binding protein IscA
MANDTPDGSVRFTEAARDHLRDAARAHGLWQFGVRVKTVGKDLRRGYDLSFDEFATAEDTVLTSMGLKLFVPTELLRQIQGAGGLVIDLKGNGLVFRTA